MAKRITEIYKYVGTSLEDKPSSCPEGSILYCADTKKYYIYHEGVWYLKN